MYPADYISNLCIYLQVLQLLRKAPLTVRYTICQQVLSMLYNTPHHVNDISFSPGWESLFLWQLTHFQETPSASTPVVRFESHDPEQANCSESLNQQQNDTSSYKRIKSLSVAQPLNLPSIDETGKSEAHSDIKSGKTDSRLHPSVATVPASQGSASLLAAAAEEQSQGRYRSRSSAFVDPKSKEERPIFISDKLGVVDTTKLRQRVKPKKRGSLSYSKCWDDTVETESDEMSRTCNIVTETVAYILWRSTDNHADRPPWKV